jgi:hypothetical protein
MHIYFAQLRKLCKNMVDEDRQDRGKLMKRNIIHINIWYLGGYAV